MTTQEHVPPPPAQPVERHDMDERVSLHPLDAADVLRALLATPPSAVADSESTVAGQDRSGTG